MKPPLRLPRVKVCGISSLDAVRDALALGIDAIGLVEYPRSPRALTPTAGRALVEDLPDDLLVVAVMVDRPPRYAATWMDEVGANVLQLCGAERPSEWQDFEAPILRRVGVTATAGESEAEIRRWKGVAAGFVLDHPSGPGGTGTGVDLERAATLCGVAPCLLAGGLSAENVRERVARVHPAGVDASSKLESAPGVKDPARVRAFVSAAREAFAEAQA